jgi:hypothetical protein
MLFFCHMMACIWGLTASLQVHTQHCQLVEIRVSATTTARCRLSVHASVVRVSVLLTSVCVRYDKRQRCADIIPAALLSPFLFLLHCCPCPFPFVLASSIGSTGLQQPQDTVTWATLALRQSEMVDQACAVDLEAGGVSNGAFWGQDHGRDPGCMIGRGHASVLYTNAICESLSPSSPVNGATSNATAASTFYHSSPVIGFLFS